MRKPNLLFIFTDEQRYDSMLCYGNTFIQTPNLDGLADESIVFERAYVTQPVCTPARASIMTGLYPHTAKLPTNDISLPDDVPTIAEMVSPDYKRAYIGKWHLGDELSAQHGFDTWISTEDGYVWSYSSKRPRPPVSDYCEFLTHNGFEPNAEIDGERIFTRGVSARMPEEFTKATFTAREAERFIRENKADPFVLYINFLEPHMPYTGPFDNLYDPKSLPQSPAFLKKPAPNSSLYHQLMAEIWENAVFDGQDLSKRQGWLTMQARYWGLVTLVDRAVGRILRALEESGAADNTIVVFTSDHGDMMGDHSILAKCVMYEEAVRVPLLVRVPWLGRSQWRISRPIGQVDIVPTLLELMGQPIPGHLEGTSRANVIEGGNTLDDDVFIEWNSSLGIDAALPSNPNHRERIMAKAQPIHGQPMRTIVTSDSWKLTLSHVDQCELHDLNEDPHELRNLFNAPAQKARIADLTAKVRQWQKRTSDDCCPAF